MVRMPPFTSHYYRDHYRPIQWEKYTQVWPLIHSLLPPCIPSMLDLGIGYGWWESFLGEKGIVIPRIVGVDIHEDAIAPRREGIEYSLTPRFHSNERFHFVACWDAYHLLGNMNIWEFLQPNGLLLLSEPRPFTHLLDEIPSQYTVLVDAWVGSTEQSRVLLARKNFP